MPATNRRRRATGLLLAAVLAAGSTVGVVATGTLGQAAQAAATTAKVLGPGKPSEPGFVGYVLADNGQLGVARLADGTYALCIDTGAGHPWPTGTLTSAYKSDRLVAYLLGRYLPAAQTDPYTAAALWWVVGVDEQLDSNPTEARQQVTDLQTQDAAAYQKVAAARTAMLADARAHAAPAGGYRPNPPVISYASGSGTVGGLGFKDRSGNWMSGYAMTVQLTGGGRFPNGSATATVTSGGQPGSVSWIQTGTSPVTATVTLTGAPADRYVLFTAPTPQQRTVTAAAPTGRSASATVPNGYVRVVVTDAATSSPLAGAGFTAWRDDDNDGVEDSDEAPVTLTSDSTGSTGLVTVLQGEPVCVTETAAATDYRRSTGTSCVTATGTEAQPTVVTVSNQRIWRPTVSTTTAPAIPVATQPRATVTVADTGAHPTTLTWTLLGPVTAAQGSDQSGDVCAGLTWGSAPVTATGTVAVTGDGTYKVAAPALTKPGCYSWAESTLAHSLIRAVTVPPGQPGATFAAQAAPGIVSQINLRHAAPGASLSDTLTVTGTTGQVVTGTWTLHGPMTPPYSGGRYTCAAVNWAKARVAAHGTFATGQDGAVTVGASKVSTPGCYTYTASVDAGPTVSAIPETTPGAAASSSRVMAAPTLTSHVRTERTTTGTTLYDSLALLGTARQSVRGTWTLYGPLAPRTVGGRTTCAGLNWAKARRVARDNFNARRDGTLAVGATIVRKSGCYTYTENLWASATTNAFATTKRGIAAETSYLRAR